MKNHLSIKSILFSGIAATAAMTLFTFMAPLMGFEMNIPKMLASTMGAPIYFGWAAHFMIGVILTFNFAAFFLTRTKSSANLKSGLLFGLIPWLISQVMVMPMMTIVNGGSYSGGFFTGSIMLAMASLAGHLIFGAVLGLLYKPAALTEASA